MPDRYERFDTAALSGRLSRSGWRRFRAEAIAGRHGAELAEPRWSRRTEWVWMIVLVATIPLFMPAMLISFEGVEVWTVAVSALWFGCFTFMAVTIVWWGRRDFWGPQARMRYRLSEFARANASGYEPEPAVSRPAAHIFASDSSRRHLDRIEVSGPTGFAVANYREIRDDGMSEATGHDAAYAVWRLRESYPHTVVADRMRLRIRALRDIAPVDGPGGLCIWSTKPEHPLLRRLLTCGVIEQAAALPGSTQLEIVGDELFLLRNGAFWPMTSKRLWAGLAAVSQALAPFVDTEVRPSSASVVAARPAVEERLQERRKGDDPAHLSRSPPYLR